jgi:hypothetical protein
MAPSSYQGSKTVCEQVDNLTYMLIHVTGNVRHVEIRVMIVGELLELRVERLLRTCHQYTLTSQADEVLTRAKLTS